MLSKRTAIGVLAAALLCAAALGSQALAGKKKATKVVLNSGSVLSGQQNVKVTGSLNTTSACKPARDMRLFLTDQAGAVDATIDSATSQSGGSWRLQTKLTSPPTADQRLQVKVKKLAVGKFVCKAGLSELIEIK